MNHISRRQLLRSVPVGGLALLLDGPRTLRRLRQAVVDAAPAPAAAESLDPLADEGAHHRSEHDPLQKIRDFDRTYADDYLLGESRLELLVTTAARLERAVGVIGHGNFNLVSFDELLRFAVRYEEIGAFPPAEVQFLEEIFHTDATLYGFYGQKVVHEQTATFAERDVERIGSTGHYLLRGDSLERYQRIRRDIGERVFLTSGVRGVVKQFQLFLSKAVATNGNLSQASRSLAPPGYSYHAVGDFDVGRVGFGLKNFTVDFADTPEYRKLLDLGYVDVRYTETNPFGVRHEPWHIKIA
jgi:D-alanyl-D-alanine carboxypeptidase